MTPEQTKRLDDILAGKTANAQGSQCKRCKELEARIKELENSARVIADEWSEAEARLISKLEESNRKNRETGRQLQEQIDAQYWREDEVKRLERAHERGDAVEAERITARIKRGW